MECVELGKSDLKVSRIGLGAMQFAPAWIGDKEMMKKVLACALDNGINFIDTAERYGLGMSETVIGETIMDRGDRDDLVIVTKVSLIHLRYKDVIKAAEASLKRLQTDVIDLYQIHAPSCYVPTSETMKAMDWLLKEGKVRYVGLSNYPVCRTREAIECLKNGDIITNQLEYSVVMRDIEAEMLPFLRETGIVTIAYSPLAMGILTGKYVETTEIPKEDPRLGDPLFKNGENLGSVQPVISLMREIAEAHEATVAQVALNWLLRFDDVFPIPGAKTPEQVESNINATKWKLSEEEWNRITEASDELDLNFFLDFGRFLDSSQ
ncbi:MAG: aldo/keto reductase [Methanobacteriota archaeon]|nr:MAG: aldo/keto reductase [Euryarchaeota archaeon]